MEKDKKKKLEDIVCPECTLPLLDTQLAESLVCPGCRTDLKTAKYLDFIEYLVANGIVVDIDFFDTEIYQNEIERLDPSDQEEVDPQDYEKKKDTFSLFESEVEKMVDKKDTLEEIDEWEGLEEDWEDFNKREDESELKKKKK